MSKLIKFGFRDRVEPADIEEDVGLAIFSAECVYGKPRVRVESSYLVSPDGVSCVLDVSGESGEAVARIFAGLAAIRVGEDGFAVQRLPEKRDGGKRRRCRQKPH